MKDNSKATITNIVESYWWLPFLVITIAGMFYSVLSSRPVSDVISIMMLVSSVLSFIGWLTRKKPDKPAEYSKIGGEENDNQVAE